jgi:hypothetical protein
MQGLRWFDLGRPGTNRRPGFSRWRSHLQHTSTDARLTRDQACRQGIGSLGIYMTRRKTVSFGVDWKLSIIAILYEMPVHSASASTVATALDGLHAGLLLPLEAVFPAPACQWMRIFQDTCSSCCEPFDATVLIPAPRGVAKRLAAGQRLMDKLAKTRLIAADRREGTVLLVGDRPGGAHLDLIYFGHRQRLHADGNSSIICSHGKVHSRLTMRPEGVHEIR